MSSDNIEPKAISIRNEQANALVEEYDITFDEASKISLSALELLMQILRSISPEDLGRVFSIAFMMSETMVEMKKEAQNDFIPSKAYIKGNKMLLDSSLFSLLDDIELERLMKRYDLLFNEVEAAYKKVFKSMFNCFIDYGIYINSPERLKDMRYIAYNLLDFKFALHYGKTALMEVSLRDNIIKGA